ncbi:transcriptional regulator [Nocardiopsis dassonvillei]|uniref:transcriptional regulator n=1 Tax=Nocardiopsis dassonvillei TaxID=2014 RepID=UPI00362512FF
MWFSAAFLVPWERAEFSYVRDTVEVSASSLSQHATALEKTGYMEVLKARVGRRARTWLSTTPSGKRAFERHPALLNGIASYTPEQDASRSE